jgi:hypothetical protein
VNDTLPLFQRWLRGSGQVGNIAFALRPDRGHRVRLGAAVEQQQSRNGSSNEAALNGEPGLKEFLVGKRLGECFPKRRSFASVYVSKGRLCIFGLADCCALQDHNRSQSAQLNQYPTGYLVKQLSD